MGFIKSDGCGIYLICYIVYVLLLHSWSLFLITVALVVSFCDQTVQIKIINNWKRPLTQTQKSTSRCSGSIEYTPRYKSRVKTLSTKERHEKY